MKKTVFTFAALPSFDAIDAALFWNLAIFKFSLYINETSLFFIDIIIITNVK